MGHRHVFPISMKKTLVKMTFKLILNMYTSPNSLRYVLFKLKFGGLILSKFNHFLYGKNKTLVKNVKASPSSFLHLRGHLILSSYSSVMSKCFINKTSLVESDGDLQPNSYYLEKFAVYETQAVSLLIDCSLSYI